MIPNPNLVHYACIARGATLLAEFNSKDAALGAVAARCLEKTPPHHAEFSHTVRSRTHTFLIDAPLVYFAIFDENLENSEGMAFLRSARAAFAEIFAAGQRRLEKVTSHCFQGEFNPVFRQLLGPAPYHMEGGLGSPTQGVSFRPKPGGGDVMVRKMKNVLLAGNIRVGVRNKESDDNGGSGIGLCREFLNRNDELLSTAQQKAHHKAHLKAQHHLWKKHLWIVLSLDLIVCAILFVVWLWVCNGLQCMES